MLFSQNAVLMLVDIKVVSHCDESVCEVLRYCQVVLEKILHHARHAVSLSWPVYQIVDLATPKFLFLDKSNR